jgi:hypothetical protein
VVGWASAPGVSVSVNIGPGAGWFPLAPREVYAPYYPCTPHYVRHVNYSHVPRIERAELFIGGPGRVVRAPPAYRYRDEWRSFDGPGRRFNERPPRIISPGNSLFRPPQAQPPAAPPIAVMPSPGRQPVAPTAPVVRHVPLPSAMNRQLVTPQQPSARLRDGRHHGNNGNHGMPVPPNGQRGGEAPREPRRQGGEAGNPRRIMPM